MLRAGTLAANLGQIVTQLKALNVQARNTNTWLAKIQADTSSTSTHVTAIQSAIGTQPGTTVSALLHESVER